MKNITIVLPTYNERENISVIIHQLFEILPNCNILVVDDNSPDGTKEVVKELQKNLKRLHLVIRKENRGRGSAGIEGFKKALELGSDIIVEMDADLSHSPYDLPKLINKIEDPNIDIVVGSRYVKGGKDQERSIVRKIISLFARLYLRIILGIPLKDVTSGYKIYKRKVIEKILPHLTAKDPFIVSEVNYICKIFNFKFSEVSITFHKRTKGKSKLTSFKLFKYLFKSFGLVIRWFFKDPYNVRLLYLILFFSLIKIMLIPLFGLTDDEAHYWQYSQNLDFSYYDHPPMVGYLIYFFAKILGNTTLAVRLPALFCFIVANFFFYLLIRELFSSRLSFYSSLLFNVIPIYFIGSIVMLPDSPLGMFWMIYFYSFYKFIKNYNITNLYFSGFILGLALLSKYNAVFLLMSSLLILLLSKNLRRWIIRKELLVFLIIILFTFSPVLLWNITHNFASFTYQLNHGLGGNIKFSLVSFFKSFFTQSLYLSIFPYFFFLFVIFKFFLKKKSNVSFQEKYLMYASLPGIVFFNSVSFFKDILPHWPAICYSTLIPFIIIYFKNKIIYYISFAFSSLIVIFVFVSTIFGLITIPKNLENADTPDKLYGWQSAAKELINLKNMYPDTFLLTHKYYTAGQLRFAIARYYEKIKQKIPEIFCINESLDQYDFWLKDLKYYNDKDAIFISESRFPEQDILKKYPFESVKIISEISYRKSKVWPRRVFKFYYCKKFKLIKLENSLVQDKYNNNFSVLDFLRNYDKVIFLKINMNRFSRKKIFKTVSFIFSSIGSGYFLIPIMFFLLYLFDKKNIVYNFIVFLFIISSGGFLTQVLKWIFDKPRPLKLFSDYLNQPINVIGEQLREFSFPSGHTFLAFSSAVFFSERAKKYYITFISYFFAVLVGLSRICVGAHFLSDVIGGSLVGVIYTRLCLKIESIIV